LLLPGLAVREWENDMRNRTGYARAVALLAAGLTAVAMLNAAPVAHANGVAFHKGDVLAGLGSGKIAHFKPDGTLLDTLDDTSTASEQTGMCFDSSLSLFATNFQDNTVAKFSSAGALTKASFGSGYNNPESCVVDNAGDIYFGNAGAGMILKFSASGTLLKTFTVQRQSRGADWIDLAADQCTLLYTSEGTLIKRFNACTNTQLTDFATLPGSPCYAHRERPNGEAIVACSTNIYRVSAAGVVTQTYAGTTLSNSSGLFAVNLDPDGTSFWTSDGNSGKVFRVDIATGAVLKEFASNQASSFQGIAVVGEITVAQPTPTPTVAPTPTPTPTPKQTGTLPATGLATSGGSPGAPAGSPLLPLGIILGGVACLALGSRARQGGVPPTVP
jgi:sugar lactone lactonase YvrE